MRICVQSLAVLVFCSSPAFANSAPVVSNVSAWQRLDDSKLVDIYYTLADADSDTCTVWVGISGDNGATWTVPAMTFTGHIGPGVLPGADKHIVWNAGRDVPGKVGSYKARVYADDGKGGSDMVVVLAGFFAYQNNYSSQVYLPTYYIDKYETTNQTYCEFLNAADPNGVHYDSQMEIVRQGNVGGYIYTVQTGREQHPIRYETFYDAEAFAAWKSTTHGATYRLPTEQEWEKAAGWDPTLQKLWTYGSQSDTIACASCNYNNCYGGALAVGSFNGTAGRSLAKSYYGCFDMSGNLWEWTASMYDISSRVSRGGSWDGAAMYCAIAYRNYNMPSVRYYSYGFRLVRDGQ